jgi:ribulose-bisphosphate carboxylase large chain
MDRILVRYKVTCSADEIDSIAKDIALEQTVEVPEQLVTSEKIKNEIVGSIESIAPKTDAKDCFDVDIAYNAELSSYQIPQLCNLIFGNISIKPYIQVVDIHYPESFTQKFKGPQYGINGIRKLIGIYNRPLLSTALKPKGSSNKELAEIAYQFSLGGGDIIKDDHNLVDLSLDAFTERIRCCQEAVEKGNEDSGRITLYFPNVCVPFEQIDAHIESVLRCGIRGILISPYLVGLDTIRYINENYPIIQMAHPTFSGTYYHDRTHGINHGVLLGQLFRLMGVDSSIFPNYGGRFGFTLDDCHGICNHLRQPWDHIASAFPAPAGGMKFDNIPTMANEYGAETIFLIGGALLSDSDNLSESTKKFLDKIVENFEEELDDPDIYESACEFSAEETTDDVKQHIAFQESFEWQDRPAADYKMSGDLPFQDVKRIELIGKYGEKTAFDLRYFEIEPGGYTSLEKHQHTHTVICLRGEGIFYTEDDTIALKPYDIAYTKPMQVHQLKNISDQPFGFFCIVDHERDRPQKP